MILLTCIHCCCCGKSKHQGSRVQPLHPSWQGSREHTSKYSQSCQSPTWITDIVWLNGPLSRWGEKSDVIHSGKDVSYCYSATRETCRNPHKPLTHVTSGQWSTVMTFFQNVSQCMTGWRRKMFCVNITVNHFFNSVLVCWYSFLIFINVKEIKSRRPLLAEYDTLKTFIWGNRMNAIQTQQIHSIL